MNKCVLSVLASILMLLPSTGRADFEFAGSGQDEKLVISLGALEYGIPAIVIADAVKFDPLLLEMQKKNPKIMEEWRAKFPWLHEKALEIYPPKSIFGWDFCKKFPALCEPLIEIEKYDKPWGPECLTCPPLDIYFKYYEVFHQFHDVVHENAPVLESFIKALEVEMNHDTIELSLAEQQHFQMLYIVGVLATDSKMRELAAANKITEEMSARLGVIVTDLNEAFDLPLLAKAADAVWQKHKIESTELVKGTRWPAWIVNVDLRADIVNIAFPMVGIKPR